MFIVRRPISSFLLVALSLLCCVVILPGTAHAATQAAECQAYNVPIALVDGQLLQYSIYGELCNPSTGPSRTVQLLVPGGTYGHIYWDFPTVDRVSYSYVQAANAAGYSTFNIDRLGIGQSSHPDLSVVTVTMYTNAFVLHEVVQDLLNGLSGNPPFARVLLVGHSLGSLAAMIEAGTPVYHDVAGVILTGLLHHISAIKLIEIVASLYPASLDPRFAGVAYGAGYLTTEPGTRGDDFYSLSNADSNVLAEDEATKETATLGEFQSFADPLILGTSELITVPVLLVVGQQDSIFCSSLATDCSSNATVQQAEAPFYSPQAQLQTVVIPESGHDLNLHPGRNASGVAVTPAWFSIGLAWSLRNVAP